MADEIPPVVPPTGELPAAALVVTKSPREIELELEIETEKQKRIEAERVAAEHEDRLQQVVALDSRRPNPATLTPATRVKKKGGWTFFDAEED